MTATIITITVIVTGLVGALGRSYKTPKPDKIIQWMRDVHPGCTYDF